MNKLYKLYFYSTFRRSSLRRVVFALLLVLFTATSQALESNGTSDAQATTYHPVFPKLKTECVLQIVADEMMAQLKKDVPLPKINFSSDTRLEDFQAAVKEIWQDPYPDLVIQIPNVVTNVFVWTRNEIYLVNTNYGDPESERILDDSLAHELVHYVQMKHQGKKNFTDHMERQAVAVQLWFRQTYFVDKKALPKICLISNSND